MITGYCGFVGGILTRAAASEGYDVWGTDRLEKPTCPGAANYTAADLLDRNAVHELMDAARPDYIAHLAAQSSVRRSFDDPAGTILNNTVPVLHILGYLQEKKSTCRLLAVGSADEYGPVKSPSELPLREDHHVHPESPYALAKTIQGRYCRRFASLYGVDVVVTRSFNHTGAGQTDTFVLPSFARQIVEIKKGVREPVIAVGDLEVKRDFSDVRDVCAAYLRLFRHGKKGEVYNVCSGRSFSIRELLDKMCELAGINVEVKKDPARLRPVDTPELRGDASRLREHTGWEPVHAIEDTLRALLDYWDEKIPAPGEKRDTKT